MCDKQGFCLDRPVCLDTGPKPFQVRSGQNVDAKMPPLPQSQTRIIKIDTRRRFAQLRLPLFSFLSSLPLPPSFVVPTHVASAPFLSEAFGKIEYADDRDRGGRGSGSSGGAKANAEAASPPSLPPPAMQTKFGATGKSY